jgi:hypothetical protein
MTSLQRAGTPTRAAGALDQRTRSTTMYEQLIIVGNLGNDPELRVRRVA